MSPTDPWARIDIQLGDITRCQVDALVNAANSRLAGGGGVDGAIHIAAGAEQLQATCRKLGSCATGDAKITPGFNLPARFIIHTVGPVYSGGTHGEPAQLASCYQRSLELAVKHDLHSIAFPAISTGVYGYPIEAATEVALDTVYSFLQEQAKIERVVFVFFSRGDYEVALRIRDRLRDE